MNMLQTTKLRAGRFGVRIPVGAKDFSRLQKVQIHSQDHPASCSMGTGTFPGDKAARA